MLSKLIWITCVLYLIGNGLLLLTGILGSELTHTLLGETFLDRINVLMPTLRNSLSAYLGGEKSVMLLAYLVHLLGVFELLFGFGVLFLGDCQMCFGLLLLKFFPQLLYTAQNNLLQEHCTTGLQNHPFEEKHIQFMQFSGSSFFWLTVACILGLAFSQEQKSVFSRDRYHESFFLKFIIGLLTLLEVGVWITVALNPVDFFETAAPGLPFVALSLNGIALYTAVAAWCGCAMLPLGMSMILIKNSRLTFALSILLQLGISLCLVATRNTAVSLVDKPTVDFTNTSLLFHIPCIFLLLGLWMYFEKSQLNKRKLIKNL